MNKFNLDEWRILRTGKTIDFAIIAGITLLFLSVIAMNVNLIFQMTSDQTEEIGQMQLDIIRSDLESKIINSENTTQQLATEAENLLASGISEEELTKFFYRKKAEQKILSNGVCFNAYIANKSLTIIPDFDIPENYHATERIWYKGAAENPRAIYISEPYIDAASGNMCFTMSKMLPDLQTVVGLDFTFSDMQESISKMTAEKDRTALIVNKKGMIIGYTDMTLVGENISRKLPEYEKILARVVQDQTHVSFRYELDGTDQTIFSSETNNGWYLILSVNNLSLYRDSYRQMVLTIVVSLLMLIVIVIFYLNGMKNRLLAEKALRVKEEFLSNLSTELRGPLDRILKLSNVTEFESGDNPMDSASKVRESALQLSDMLDNLFSFSNIVTTAKTDNDEKFEQWDNLSRVSQFSRIGIIMILTLSMMFSMALCINTTINWGDAKMNREADVYDYQLSNWIAKEKSILSVFTNLISERPYIMDDYNSAVDLLNDIAKNYPEISVCYMTNPYNEYTVIMNNGWLPPEGWKVEDRQWYKDTEKSDDGFNISAPYYDEQTGLYCVTLSQIVYGPNGEFLGIFGIDFFLDKLIQILDESYTRDGYAFLVDKNGIIINHPNSSYQMSVDKFTPVSATEYTEAYFSDGVERITDFNNVNFACLAKKNAASDFTVIVANRWWNIYGNVISLGIVFVILLILCVVAVIVLINRQLNWQQSVNQKLQEAANTAIVAGNAKSQFLAQMSHEIRTPLNAVLGMNELILRENKNSDIAEYARNIQNAGKTLLTLINNILDFSKIEDGKMKVIPILYDTSNLISDLVNIVSERAHKKGLKFVTEIDPNLPRSLYGDDVRIRQIITNLLTNAVKYTQEGTVTLVMTCEFIDDDSINMFVQVKDTGIGIKKEDIDKLFLSFQRLDEEKNRNIEGTGLGISIVQKLLTMMGSKLEVESVYGIGSSFSFHLKQKIIDKVPIGDYKTHIVEKFTTDTRKYFQARDAKIIVVDDNRMNLKVARGFLKYNGIVPDMVDSGEKCIEYARKTSYDIIFLDHMMPGMDGVETLQRLKALGTQSKIIAMTANAISGAHEFYIKEGFDDYISKPIDPEMLESLLLKYLPKDLINYDSEEIIEPEEKNSEAVETDSKTSEAVENVEEVDEEETDEDTFSEKEKRLFERICPDFNLDAAMSYCMHSKEFFIEMMQDFYSDDKTDSVNKTYDEKDYKNYKILVHGLKSTSQIIGALQFSDLAKSQEMAAKDENIRELEKNHAAFMQFYKTIRDEIGEWLEMTGNAKDSDR